MSRNRPVRGPRSALTSFLEERGIRNANPAPVIVPELIEEHEDVNIMTENGLAESSTVQNEVVSEVKGNSSDGNSQLNSIQPKQTRSQVKSESKDLGEPKAKAGKTRKGKAPPKKKGKAQKKRTGSKSSDSDFESELEDYVSSDESYNPKSRFSSAKNNASTGGVSFCSICNRRFVVLVNTLRIDGRLVCGDCEKKPPKDPKAPRLQNSRQTKKRRRHNTLKADADWFDSESLPSLQSICIQVVCNNIDSVDSFGDLSSKTLTQISRILSKHRHLDDATLPLFLAQSTNSLSLFDCARLSEDSLIKIAHFGQSLTELKLQFCGRMNDEILGLFSRNLPVLTDFTLHGSFLVTEAGFLDFFSNAGNRLKHFSLLHSPKFGMKSMVSLVEHCPQLQKLTISYCEKINDSTLKLLVNEHSKSVFPLLETLDLSYPGPEASDESLIKVLPIIGSNLRSLNLAGWKNLSDDAIICGVKEGCPKLSYLDLSSADKLTTDGLTNLLDGLAQEPLGSGLSELYLADCSILIEDTILKTLLSNHYKTLTKLSISGLDGLSGLGIEEAFMVYPPRRLTELNVSWVRAISDPLLAKVLPLLPSLKVLHVWGCHKQA
ncbi:UV-damaged DNA-binding protein rad7, variant 2 [Entomophthora muscae]|uniref:UV-damaged DNA-binding protein rad7, variant 2 n=1 Tax=Entomophthora muscae TaxID=34485 RepID=A0ACC2THN5_9FUNG|nr:UV-damaged DNA-binding protein rad7, variant 2 [Entomophthora muscae]